MNTADKDIECIPQQIRVFSKWVSNHLSKYKSYTKVSDVTKDFKNGLALIELSEVLVDRLLHNWNLRPKEADDMIRNNDMAIDHFIKDGVHLTGITGKEVNDSKEKFILGLLWTLIVHYSIGKSVRFNNDANKINDKTKFSTKAKVLHSVSEKHYKQALMQWAIDRTEYYPGVKEFQPLSLSLCALLDSYFPEKVNFYSIDPTDKENIAKIVTNKMDDLKLPLLFSVEDLQSSEIDDKALLTQIAVLKISIEQARPFEKTISKSRTLILDDEFISHKEEGNNKKYAGRKFGLIMTLKETDYKDGHGINPSNEQVTFGEDIQLALTLTNIENPYLNPSGRMLNMQKPDIKNNSHQQFIFGDDEWSTVIDSIFQKGMVWDVADEFNPNPPAGTPFYVFPFHGRHNQHFIYKNGMIYAQQNGHVVTYVGGDEPLVMMPPNKALKARQTFRIQLL